MKQHEDAEDEEESDKTSKAPKGYVLEYDAARKIAQGLGAHLESLSSLVEVKGETARLLPVAERTRKLFGKDEAESPSSNRKKKSPQLELGFVAELKEAEEAGTWGCQRCSGIGGDGSGPGTPMHDSVCSRARRCPASISGR